MLRPMVSTIAMSGTDSGDNKMKMRTKMILFSATLAATQNLVGNVITFFMRPFPHVYPIEKKLTQQQIAKKSKKLQRPEKIAKYTLRSILESNASSGIFCTYMGQLALSSHGQVTFARRQVAPHIKLLITEKINPILMNSQTIHHWEIEGGHPASLYLVEQKVDPETEIEFWDVKKIALPENNIISLDSIIIFAKPSHIVVPQGITIVEREAQLLLPDLYVKKNIDKLASSLYVLNLKRFFNQTKPIYQIKPTQYSKILE